MDLAKSLRTAPIKQAQGVRTGRGVRPEVVRMQERTLSNDEVKSERTRKTRSIFVSILGVAITLTGCSKGVRSAGRVNASATIRIQSLTAREETLPRRVEAVGSLLALDESTISSQVEGPVTQIAVDVGDVVKEGQVMVSIDPTELQYAVETQRAAVRQVRAQLGIGPDDPPPSDPSKVALVQRAAADLFDAKQKFDRAQALFEAQLISPEDRDSASARYENAHASRDLAIQQVDQLVGQLQSSEAMRRLAEKKVADASIRAPFNGAVKERKVNLGEYLKVQSPVMVLVRMDQLRARLEVPEKWAGAVHIGATVDVQVGAYPNQTFQGKLTRINPAVNPDSRTFEVEAIIPNRESKLKPGFFVQGSLPSDVEEKIVTIPQDAIKYVFGTYSVFVVNGGHLAERTIKPGAQNQTPQGVRVEVIEGLRAGERIAVAPAGTTLYDGAPVHE
jgi:RND family efflux transporter MFP subunit